MARTGRPSKLTPEVQEKICQAIREGNFLYVAAFAAGVNPVTVQDWLARGQIQGSGKYYDFVVAFRQAEAEAERKAVMEIRKAGAEGDWRANLEWLKRRCRERWGDAPLEVKAEVIGKQDIVATLVTDPVIAERISEVFRERVQKGSSVGAQEFGGAEKTSGQGE